MKVHHKFYFTRSRGGKLPLLCKVTGNSRVTRYQVTGNVTGNSFFIAFHKKVKKSQKIYFFIKNLFFHKKVKKSQKIYFFIKKSKNLKKFIFS
jgi:hypothetical protein